MSTLRYLHFLRHYQAKRLEAGYHKLDKSKIKEKDISVKNMDDLENIGAAADAATPNFNAYENMGPAPFTTGSGHGYAGFYLDYWQQSC